MLSPDATIGAVALATALRSCFTNVLGVDFFVMNWRKGWN
jgi:hypothetical protein